MNPWAIDAEGRIFYEGRFVALIERSEDSDGSCSTAFCTLRVEVDDTSKPRLLNRIFESRVSSTSDRVRLTKDEWDTLNATAQAKEETR